MRRLTLTIAAGTIAPMLAFSSAHAATTTRSCSAGGFTGSISVTHDADLLRITHISYKINKGSNSGGNNANVYWNDGGTLPATSLATGTARQDNTWRTFWSADYTRGGGGTTARFVFDKSNASDPSCTIRGVL